MLPGNIQKGLPKGSEEIVLSVGMKWPGYFFGFVCLFCCFCLVGFGFWFFLMVMTRIPSFHCEPSTLALEGGTEHSCLNLNLYNLEVWGLGTPPAPVDGSQGGAALPQDLCFQLQSSFHHLMGL